MSRKNLQSRPMSDAHIHAYVDGQLKQERGQSLESILGDIPEKYEQLEEYQRINESLVSTLQPILNEPIPNSILMLFKNANGMSNGSKTQSQGGKTAAPTNRAANLKQNKRDVIRPELKSEPKPLKQKSNGGAELEMENDFEYKSEQIHRLGNSTRTIPFIVILCIISFIVGWNVRNQFKFNEERVAEFVNQAINSDSIFIGEQQEITEARSIDRILRKKFTRPLHIPDSKELSLQGGRILPYGQSGVAAMLAYKALGETVSLYITQRSGLVTVEIPFCENVKPITVCYWHRDDMNFAVVSKLKEEKLRGVAKSFLQQLLHKPGEVKFEQ